MYKKLAAFFLCTLCFAFFAVSAETLVTETVSENGLFGFMPDTEANTSLAEESICDYLHNAMLRFETRIDVSGYQITRTDFGKYFSMTLAMYPDLYYVVSTSYGIALDGNIVALFAPKYETTDKAAITAEVAKINAAIDEYLAGIDPYLSDLDKLLILHDRLVLWSSYDTTYTKYTARDILVDGTAVCQGYANAYYALAARLGITGGIVVSDEMNHAWNAFVVNNYWYHVDTTWDDPVSDQVGRVSHKHFLKSNAAMTDSLEHYGFEPLTDDGDMYDNAFWNDVRAQIFPATFAYFYLSDSQKAICRYSTYTSQTEVLYALNHYWRSASGSAWKGAFSGLALRNGRLYFNLSNGLYSCDFEGGDVRAESFALTAEQANTYSLYGMYMRGEKLYFGIGTKADAGKTSLYEQSFMLPAIDNRLYLCNRIDTDVSLYLTYYNEGLVHCNFHTFGKQNGRVTNFTTRWADNLLVTVYAKPDQVYCIAMDDNLRPLAKPVKPA